MQETFWSSQSNESYPEEPPLLIIPSVDIQDGKCVKLVQGKPGTGLKVSNDPVSVAEAWEEAGAKIIHVVDLDGALQGKPVNSRIISEIISNIKIPVEVGGGIRTIDDAKELVKLGADWIITGTAAMQNPEFIKILKKALDASKIMISVDSKEDHVVTKGWVEQSPFVLEDAFRIFNPMKIGGYLYTDITVEGTKKGINTTKVAKLVKIAKRPVTYSGGVSSLEDIRALAGCGIRGVVVGRALYDGNFTLQEAEEAVRI